MHLLTDSYRIKNHLSSTRFNTAGVDLNLATRWVAVDQAVKKESISQSYTIINKEQKTALTFSSVLNYQVWSFKKVSIKKNGYPFYYQGKYITKELARAP